MISIDYKYNKPNKLKHNPLIIFDAFFVLYSKMNLHSVIVLCLTLLSYILWNFSAIVYDFQNEINFNALVSGGISSKINKGWNNSFMFSGCLVMVHVLWKCWIV